ncbi:helix-turn-helix transcriptional regulator [Streptomyces sp. ST2-7A]|uniref:helix-turn-helix domain-containing protein n=1 Tax=Streptomyces sp. ST2-7A TaxID=2907214 RepID=UPI001F266017|nr:helix-turn-helix transcriptional regulator [Streptomyces sp. ST2-7A]MCE7083315.1 helix-turn-helix domain-containing protein [Streptomyces sp. ST2-7A]
MVRRILLGAQLRRLRESRGVTREAAGYSIRASESKISRMELGRVSFKPRDVADLLTLYGVIEEAEREPLLNLARASNRPGWWHSYNDVLPGWFPTFVGLEAAASAIATYEVQFVPGLLQSEEYAHAVVVGNYPDLPADEVDRRVALRMGRQKILVGENAPHLHCVLDEGALRRVYGGRAVMRDQLKLLAEYSETPNISLRVVPFDRTDHPVVSGAFVILSFSEVEISDVVYLEQLTSALYLDKEDEVAEYRRTMNALAGVAATPEETRRLLHEISREL